jgi:hypothetical protein
LSKEEKILEIKAGTIIERMNLVYQSIQEFQDDIILEMSREFPKSKIQKRIRELILVRAKNFRRSGLSLTSRIIG